MSAFYKTTTSDYGTKWAVSNEKKPLATEIPTYKQIGENLPQFRKAEKVLKNQLVAAKWGKQSGDEELDALTAAKRKLDQNAIVAKKLPVEPGQNKITEQGKGGKNKREKKRRKKRRKQQVQTKGTRQRNV